MGTTPYVRLWNFFIPETRWNENRHDNKSIIRAMPLTWPPLRRRIQWATAWTTHPIIRRNIRWYFRIYISVQNVFLIHRFLVRVYLKVGQNFHFGVDDDAEEPERRCRHEPCITGLISVEVNKLAWISLAFFRGKVLVAPYVFRLWCRMIEQKWRLENARPRKIGGLPLRHLVILNGFPRITLTQTNIPIDWAPRWSISIICC